MVCLLGGLAQVTVAQTGIIGINTENPKGVLHIDGASNNPATGNVSTDQAKDDVVVDASGHVGIGVLPTSSPSAPRLDVDGYVRIQDGSEGAEKALISDANGVGMWTTMAGSWYAFLYNDPPPLAYLTVATDTQFTGFSGEVISSSASGVVNKSAGTIQVPFKGRYRLTISGDWKHTSVATYRGEASVRINGSTADKWAPSSWGGVVNNGTLPTFVAIVELNANDVLRAYTKKPSGGTDYANNAKAIVFGAELLQKQ
jgi:hypothetical protein